MSKAAFSKQVFTNECRRRGIYPDVRVRCARTGSVGTTWPYEWWTRVGKGFIIGVADDEQSNIWAYYGRLSDWAEPMETHPNS